MIDLGSMGYVSIRSSKPTTLTYTSSLPIGIYLVIASCSPNFNNTSGDATLSLRKNSEYITNAIISRNNAYWEPFTLSGIFSISPGDIIRVTGTDSNSSNNANNVMNIIRVA